jgi:hypothetical protein
LFTKAGVIVAILYRSKKRRKIYKSELDKKDLQLQQQRAEKENLVSKIMS